VTALADPRRLYPLLRRQPPVAALAEAAGGVETHLVGGLLRDRLLGLQSRDYDAVVDGDGREIAGRVAGALGATLVLLGGKAFAAYRVVGEGFVLDLWDRAGTTLVADLARRDFTVNSFALDLAGGALVDPFGGIADLGRRVLRATTAESFSGDPLRVLRLPRLLGQLPGFGADPATLELAHAAAPGLAAVAAERVREELVLVFKGDDAPRVLALLGALEVYPGLWRGAPGAAGDTAATGAAVAELAALPAARAELHRLAPEAADRFDRLAGRLAAAFARLPLAGGGAGGRGDGVGDDVDRFRDAGYLTARVAGRVRLLLAARELPAEEPAQRGWLHRLGELWPTAAAAAGAVAAVAGGDAAERWRRRLGRLVALVEADGEAILDPPRLLDGGEVQELLGIGPGREVGAALARLRAAQVEGRVRSREEAVRLLGASGTSPSSRRPPAAG
jgi:hypothetical protein